MRFNEAFSAPRQIKQKYRLSAEKMTLEDGIVLHRIVAMRDFGKIKKGDKGGWVESTNNLSHDDNCWIYDEAKVYGEAQVYDNAQVRDNATVAGKSK